LALKESNTRVDQAAAPESWRNSSGTTTGVLQYWQWTTVLRPRGTMGALQAGQLVNAVFIGPDVSVRKGLPGTLMA
jgi:hypothetical protein